MEMAFNMEKVEYGTTKNHLIFTGYVPTLNSNLKYRFDYTGTELTTTAGLLDDQRERLREELMKDFGYAPFDLSSAKNIVGIYKQYRIQQ